MLKKRKNQKKTKFINNLKFSFLNNNYLIIISLIIFSAITYSIIDYNFSNQERIDVSDLVDCVELAVDHQDEDFGLYNVGVGHAITVKNLVLRIITASQKSVRIKHDLSKPTIPTTLCLDCARVRRALGWTPRVPLDEGIIRTLEWYGTHINRNTDT